MNKDKDYYIVSSRVNHECGSSQACKLLYSAITKYSVKTGCCDMHNKNLAQSIHASVSTIQRALRSLKTKGLVTVQFNKQPNGKLKRSIFLNKRA